MSNLSSSRALRDVTERHGCSYAASAVGEVNVTTLMKQTGAVIGGEGNGGVIYPAAHYGRDALVGVALFLTLLGKERQEGERAQGHLSRLPRLPRTRSSFTPDIDVDAILAAVKDEFASEKITDIDGVKDRLPRVVGTSPQVKHRAHHPHLFRSRNNGRGRCSLIRSRP